MALPSSEQGNPMPDLPTDTPLAPADDLAPLRGYLLYLAEQHLGDDLHAKGGASDLVQTALLAAHQARDRYQGHSPEELRGWLRRILLNAVRKFRRRWQRCQARAVLIVTIQTSLLRHSLSMRPRAARRKRRNGR